MIHFFQKLDYKGINLYWDPNDFEEKQILQLLQSIPNWSWEKQVFLYECPIPVLRQVNFN